MRRDKKFVPSQVAPVAVFLATRELFSKRLEWLAHTRSFLDVLYQPKDCSCRRPTSRHDTGRRPQNQRGLRVRHNAC